MEVAVVILLVVAVYMWARGRERRQEDVRELRYFRHSDGEDEFFFASELDFQEMRFKEKATNPQGSVTTEYLVRRVGSSQWEVRLTDDSLQARRKRLQACIDDPDYLLNKEARREELQKLDGDPKWEPLGDDIVGPIETQYQRFLRHYEEP